MAKRQQINFPKQYKTIMALMPATGRAAYKRAMISAIIRSQERPPARTKKGAQTSEDIES
jgi:hypothetical protein